MALLGSKAWLFPILSAAILERRYFAITIISLSQRDRDTDEDRLHEGVLLGLPRRLQEESRDILCQTSTAAEPGEACNLKFSFVHANFLLIGGSHNALLVNLEQCKANTRIHGSSYEYRQACWSELFRVTRRNVTLKLIFRCHGTNRIRH